MLLDGKRSCSDSNPTELHKNDLNCKSAQNDQKEQIVVEEAREYVEISLSELTSINFIEDLHEHENVKDNGIVSELL